MSEPKHPTQPLVLDEHGTLRFKPNKIVQYLLDANAGGRGNPGHIGMNQLAVIEFSQEDREQFAQLIGYSLGGFGELSYVSDEAYNRAKEAYEFKKSVEETDTSKLITLPVGKAIIGLFTVPDGSLSFAPEDVARFNLYRPGESIKRWGVAIHFKDGTATTYNTKDEAETREVMESLRFVVNASRGVFPVLLPPEEAVRRIEKLAEGLGEPARPDLVKE